MKKYKVIGIDPGSHILGYGIVEMGGERPLYIDHGTLKVSRSLPLPDRLLFLSDNLDDLCKKHRPDYGYVESCYFENNVKGMMILSNVIGMAMTLLKQNQMIVQDITPSAARKYTIGRGNVDKKFMKEFLINVLKIPKEAQNKPLDATDALCVAIGGYNMFYNPIIADANNQYFKRRG